MKIDAHRIVLDHFNELSAFYDEKSKLRQNYLKRIDDLVTQTLNGNASKIIDVGCGTGSRTEKLRNTIKGSTVYGCDFSPKMIEIAQTKKIDKILYADMVDLPFDTGSVDSMLCLFNTLGYLPDAQSRMRALKEFYRVLSAEGLLFIDVMNRWHLGEGLSFRKSLKKSLKEYVLSFLQPHMFPGDLQFFLSVGDIQIKGWVHGFSNSEMKALLCSSGFSIERQLYIGYDSGLIKQFFWQGQLFYLCKKNSTRYI